MNQITNPVEVIRQEVINQENNNTIGIFTIKTLNQTIDDASNRPVPKDLYHSLWYEGEIACLFADTNLGKSIYAVQIGDHISKYTDHKVIFIDCELSEIQFSMRYIDKETNSRHIFSDNFCRAEITPEAISQGNYEETVIAHIENLALIKGADVIIVDNLTFLCNNSEKGDAAGTLMINLLNLKKKYGWSMLVVAHTPKRSLSEPITQNTLAGSKKLMSFFDSSFAIGQSAKDPGYRYVKQIKVRATEFKYDSDNVIVYELEKKSACLQFSFVGYAKEKDHLKEDESDADRQQVSNVMTLYVQGKTERAIAAELDMSKSKVHRIITQNKEKYMHNIGSSGSPASETNQVNQVDQPRPKEIQGQLNLTEDEDISL